MDEKVDRIEKAVIRTEKNVNGLVEIVVAMKGYMETHLATKDELADVKKELNEKIDGGFVRVDNKFEKVESKIDGLQRAVDTAFERQGMLESRVLKVETELHL